VFLLSDLARGITGEMVHVDGGYHAIGANLAAPANDDGGAG
jgi:enoyl-[acyl-carrier protein] reductase I